MTNELETGEDKIQKICNALRRETLEPALQEAETIIEAAQREADQIIHKAREEAEQIHSAARKHLEEERSVFNASLEQSAKQCFENLKQKISSSLFNGEFESLVRQHTTDPKVIANMIEGIVHAIKKEGIDTDLSGVIPSTVSAKEVNALLGEGILNKLKENGVVVGGLSGGVQVVMQGKQMTLDLSDEVLKYELALFLREDFRKMLLKD